MQVGRADVGSVANGRRVLIAVAGLGVSPGHREPGPHGEPTVKALPGLEVGRDESQS